MNDFEWTEDIPSDIYDGLEFIITDHGDDSTVFTVEFIQGNDAYVIWNDIRGNKESVIYPPSEIREYIREGIWKEL